MWDINVKSGLMLVREASSYLSEGASVVFISSVGAFGPVSTAQVQWTGMYLVSKTALLNLAMALANELGPRGVRVNCVAPGLVPTTFSSKVLEDEVLLQNLPRQVHLGRLGTVEDVAGVVAFLASEDASYITGETIVVAGGMRSRL